LEQIINSHAISFQLLTAETWVQSEGCVCGLCTGLSCTGLIFLEMLQVPLAIYVHQFSILNSGWYKEFIWVCSTKEISLTSAAILKK
jgi:hypothetical protein